MTPMKLKQQQLAAMASSRRTICSSQKEINFSSSVRRTTPIKQKKKAPSSSSPQLAQQEHLKAIRRCVSSSSEEHRNLPIPYMEQQIRWGWMRLRRNDGCQLLIQELFGSLVELDEDQEEYDIVVTHNSTSPSSKVASLLLQQRQGDPSSFNDVDGTVAIGLNQLLLIASLKIVKDKHLPLGERYAARQYYTRLLRQYTNRWISLIRSFEGDDTLIASCRLLLPTINNQYDGRDTDLKSSFDLTAAHFDIAHLYSDTNNNDVQMAYKHFQQCLLYAKSYYGTIYHPDVAHIYRGIGIANFRINMQHFEATYPNNTAVGGGRGNRCNREVYEVYEDDTADEISSYRSRRNQYIISNLNNLLDPFCMDVRIKIVLGVDYKTKYSYGKIGYLLSQNGMNLTKDQINLYFQQLKKAALLHQQPKEEERIMADGGNMSRKNGSQFVVAANIETREEDEAMPGEVAAINTTSTARDCRASG